MLADDAAGLAAVAAPYIREWLAVGDFHTREHVSACIFRLLARILFGIETVPQSLLAAAQAGTAGLPSGGTRLDICTSMAISPR